MTEPRRIFCGVCGEYIEADLPGWSHGDGLSICPGFVACSNEPTPTVEEYTRGPDAAGGVDMTPWQKMGEHKGKN